MMLSDRDIESYCKSASKYYNDNWGPNTILETFDYKKSKKVLLTLDAIGMHFNSLRKVYVCHTSSSAGLIFGLRKVFGCEVCVLTDHPLFERMHSYYNETLKKVTYKKVNCIFDDVFRYTDDADLVVFPDMEYFIPLKLKAFTTAKTICCTYMIDDHTPFTYQNIAMSDEDVDNLFGLKNANYYKAEIKGYDCCYCAIGTIS